MQIVFNEFQLSPSEVCFSLFHFTSGSSALIMSHTYDDPSYFLLRLQNAYFRRCFCTSANKQHVSKRGIKSSQSTLTLSAYVNSKSYLVQHSIRDDRLAYYISFDLTRTNLIAFKHLLSVRQGTQPQVEAPRLHRHKLPSLLPLFSASK